MKTLGVMLAYTPLHHLLLRDAGIPVVVIEGNHDCHESESKFSWLRSLSQWGFIKLLEPVYDEGGVRLTAWNENEGKGSYIDIDGVRIFGSIWYGSTISQSLPVQAPPFP